MRSMAPITDSGVSPRTIGVGDASPHPLSGEAIEETQRDLEGYTQDMTVDWATTGEYLAKLEERRIALNCAALVGHGTLWEGVGGSTSTTMTKSQLRQMKNLQM